MNSYTTEFGIEIKNDFIFSTTDDFIDETEEAILNKNIQGTQIFSPSKINIDETGKYPVLWLMSHTEFRQWQAIREQNSYLIFTSLNDGTSIALNVYPSKKRRSRYFKGHSAIGEPAENSKDTSVAIIKNIDIKELIASELAAGRYAVTLLTFDWKSNTVITDILSATAAKTSGLSIRGKENNHYLTHNKSEYGRIIDGDLNEEARNAIYLSLPNKIDYSQQMLAGNISVPVTRENLHSYGDEEGYFISVALVLAELDTPKPTIFNLTLPVKDKEYALNKTLNISFELAMSALFFEQPKINKQTYQVYVVDGKNISAPASLQVHFR